MMSQWDVRIIFILFSIIIFYGIVSIALNLFTIRIVVTQLVKRGRFESIKDNFMAKRTCIIMAMTVVTFAILLGIIRITAHQNFVIMACGLLVEFAWLIGVILISLLLRVGNDQIKSAFRIYSPLMLVGFLVITFRIILIPNSLVNFIFPLSCSSVRCGKQTSSSATVSWYRERTKCMPTSRSVSLPPVPSVHG